jgi:hypothetical protein
MNKFLFLNEKLCAPMCEIAAMTFWQPNAVFNEQTMDRIDLKNVSLLEDELVNEFLNSSPVYGLMAILLINSSPSYYLVWIPNQNAPATVMFLRDHHRFTGTIRKRIDRMPLHSRFNCSGQFTSSWSEDFDVYTPMSSIVLFSHSRKIKYNFSPDAQSTPIRSKFGTWDELISGIPQVISQSKLNEAKKMKRKCESVFFESKRRQDESHIMPNDIADLFLSETLQSNDYQTSHASLKKNQIRSKDSGGYNTITGLPKSTPSLEDNSKKCLSDYHIATEVCDAYKLKYTHESILQAKLAVSDCLLSKNIMSDNPDHNRVIGAISDKFYEGIEFRMVPETKCQQEFMSIDVDIDQVITGIFTFLLLI